MAKSLSGDLRKRVIAAVEGGLTRRAAAQRFGVSASSAVRWTKPGAASARPEGGDRRSRRIEGYAAIILAAVDKKIDITLVELVEMLAVKHGQRFAPSTLWRFLDRHGMTLKKNRARQRAGAARRRRAAPGLGARAA
jgi:transposase